MDRRSARREAVCLLFDYTFNTEKDADRLIEDARNARDLPEDEFFDSLVRGVLGHQAEIDTIIEKNLQGWTLQRLSRVSLAILRLAIYEMDYREEIPVNVTINEAVELAKRYGDEKDAAFINGLLGAYARNSGKGSD